MDGEGGGEKKGEKEEGEPRNKKSLKTGYFCPERERRARTETDRPAPRLPIVDSVNLLSRVRRS